MTSTARLAGRVAVVTGAGQGLGRAIAIRYATEGARVAVVDINADTAQAVAEEITAAGGTAAAITCDVSQRAAVNDAAARAAADLGPINVLVSNAGLTRPAMLWKMTDEQWSTVLDIHLNGAFYWLQAVVPGMQEAKKGSIIFTTSSAGLNGTIGQINYSSAKAALLGMTRSAARELASYNIVVNAVAPAAATPMTEGLRNNDKLNDNYLQRIPLKRWAEPEEIAGTYVFLASDDATYMTGQVLAIDGGLVMVR
ncbi:NAD(P)-dependent dehydrogenase, short-chain alcohol dehydrogenase family [Mycobacterium rhizamassiliense]|uniref:NAD(P)-dependent dehydrogenase, short-chain alcohol dehydrogenase family n=2 Tax=Mycobacterium TaxID=1763 RepID=A0A2U3PAK7_9MYCO|nr:MULTISPECIES: 3-oxoacyl-ACP reductase FabG [Mycobacterium]SPM34937.1 NAD(P)-dependent dehydrogenase, short-chain alcohol dehydrogenase family [Mycobacterium rhizamassiliense]SPM40766.1 NAD(P)-dependent dehydrogenase, short-chain alcohol dehydrogenase family [Mycobacterium numidiamassiliense]